MLVSVFYAFYLNTSISIFLSNGVFRLCIHKCTQCIFKKLYTLYDKFVPPPFSQTFHDLTNRPSTCLFSFSQISPFPMPIPIRASQIQNMKELTMSTYEIQDLTSILSIKISQPISIFE